MNGDNQQYCPFKLKLNSFNKSPKNKHQQPTQMWSRPHTRIQSNSHAQTQKLTSLASRSADYWPSKWGFLLSNFAPRFTTNSASPVAGFGKFGCCLVLAFVEAASANRERDLIQSNQKWHPLTGTEPHIWTTYWNALNSIWERRGWVKLDHFLLKLCWIREPSRV